LGAGYRWADLNLTYAHEELCSWVITCDGNTHPTLTFSNFNTEWNYDFLDIFDGLLIGGPETAALASFSGSHLSGVSSACCAFTSFT
jgi:hypothetical protein